MEGSTQGLWGASPRSLVLGRCELRLLLQRGQSHTRHSRSYLGMESPFQHGGAPSQLLVGTSCLRGQGLALPVHLEMQTRKGAGAGTAASMSSPGPSLRAPCHSDPVASAAPGPALP